MLKTLILSAVAALAIAAPASAQVPVPPVTPPTNVICDGVVPLPDGTCPPPSAPSAPTPPPAVAPAPPAPDPCTQVQPSVTVNGGALFTNNPVVTLTVTGCGPFQVANDGSFNPSGSFDSGAIRWALTPAGSERLPKTVYVRYRDGSVRTDDIILDTTDPVIESVKQVTPLTASAAASKRGKVFRVGRLAVRVYDASSGVRRVQTKRYGKHHYKVRATDKAGNRSAWKVVRRRAA